MKTLITISFILLCSYGASAQTTDHKAKFWSSTAIYWTGVESDILTSRGLREGNSLFRDSKGELNIPKAVTFSVVPYAISLWLDHKHHSKAANILRYTLGGAHFSVAIHNNHLRR